jgi:prevent-host-death family protein
MIVVSVREAKDRMAELIDRAIAGEEVVITPGGERVARIEGFSQEEQARLRGELRGRD